MNLQGKPDVASGSSRPYYLYKSLDCNRLPYYMRQGETIISLIILSASSSILDLIPAASKTLDYYVEVKCSH